MNSINEEKIIQQFLSELLERDLYEPIHDILAAKGYEARITHSSSELGKDLVATKPGSHNLVVSVKRGDISKPKWDTEVHPQLTQLMESPLNVNGVDESLPRRSILIVSGKLKPVVLQLLANHTDYYVSRGENPTEVWDMERLTKEIHTHLLSVALIGKEYFEDIQRLVLSIGNDSFSKIECVNFINKYLNLDKFSVFKLSFIYVLRRCEHMKNPYAFFYFAECALLNTWKYIFSKNLFSRPDEFDELHQLYMEGLENWMQTMTVALEEDYGLFDSSNGGLNEFIEYPLRVFDTLRRLSYVSFLLFSDWG